MKKLSKILVLVLSLALVLGSIMIVSSAATADPTNLKTFRSTGFTDLAPTWTVNGTGANSNFNGVSYNANGRAGTWSVGSSAGNQFLVFACDRSGGQPYLDSGYGGGGIADGGRPSATSTTEGLTLKNSVLKWPYLVYEFDVMSPTGNFAPMAAGSQMRYVKINSTGLANPGQNDEVVGINENGEFYAIADTSVTKKVENPTNFSHVTIIFAGKGNTESVSTDYYIYIDGEYFYSKQDSIVVEKSACHSNTAHLTWDGVRLNFRTSVLAGHQTAIDNFKVRVANETYDATELKGILDSKASLTTWADNIYVEADMPLGIPLLQVGETVYDSESEANAAIEAMEYVEATILSDVVDFTISKSGKVYYETAAQYDAIKTADGYGKVQKEDAGGTFAEIAPAAPKAVYYDYHWGDECTDTHFLSATANVSIGEKILSQLPTDVYTLENGLIQGYLLQGGKYVRHTGWKYLEVEIDYDDEFNEIVVGVTEGEDVALDALVTAETPDVVYLKPVFTEVDASVLANALYAVAANGTYTFYNNDVTLKAVIEAAPAGSTIVLLDDVAYDPNTNGAIGVSKKLTLDLNGKTLDARNVKKIADNNNNNKASTFNSIVDFTITSSAPGAKIFAASAQVANSGRSGPAFISLKANSKIAITATQPGYLSYYGSTPIQSYNSQVESVYVDGVNFYATITDNTGYLQITNAKTTTIKNSLFVGNHNCFIYISGRTGSTVDTRAMTATVDNCVFIGNGNIMSTSYDKLDITFTNCFLGMKLTASAVYGSGTPGKATLGAGNYISDKIAINQYVVLADGVQKYDVPSYFKTTVKTNKFKNVLDYTTQNTHADDLVLFDETYETKYVGYIGATGLADVTVALKEGEATLGTATIKSGMIPSGALGTTAAVENWVNVQKTWFADYTDEAVTADTALTNVTNAYTQAFDLTVYYQFRYTDHITLYAYVPVAPEGIEYTYAWYGSYDASRPSDRVSTNVVHIDDAEYMELKGNWAGVSSYVNGQTIGVIFTYEGQEFTYTATAKIADYANTVLANVGERYSVEDQNYVIGLATYANALFTYRGNSNADIAKIATDYADRITLPEGFGDTAYTATDISAYVESISLAVYDARARLKVTMKDAAYTISIKDANGDALAMTQKSSTAVWESGDYKFYQLVGDLTITVSDGTNTVVAEGYTLSNYAAAVKAVDANAYALVCAMYEYGVAQKELREAHAN